MSWAIFVLYFGGHIVTIVLGRPQWTKYVLMGQLGIIAALTLRAVLFVPNAPDYAGLALYSIAFFIIAAFGHILSSLSSRWLWKRNSHSAFG